MKLTAKIVSLFLLVIVVLTAVHGYLIVLREDRRLRQEMLDEAQTLGRAMEESVVVLWLEEGHQGVLEFVRTVDDLHQQIRIRWVALDSAGEGLYRPPTPLERLRGVGQMFSVVGSDERGHDLQHMYYPIDVGSTRMGCLEFAEPLADVNRYTRTTAYQVTGTVVVMLLCGVLVSLIGMRWVGRPLEQLIEKSERIGAGDLSGPLEFEGNDELSQLARAMNKMCDQLAESQEKIRAESDARVEAVEQLRHADRLKTVGRLASGVAHELGTPLNVVAGRAGLIASDRLDKEQVCESAQAIKAEADRMTTIIRQLLDFARRRAPQPTVVDVRHVAGHALDLLRTLAEKRKVPLTLQCQDQPMMTKADAGQIQQVLTNLIVNAIQATPDGGTVTVELRSEEAADPQGQAGPPAEYCCIHVRDEGTGIAPEDRQHLFEPFFTTKDVGLGTGLGLSVSYGIVRDHGGWIEVASEPGEGSCFSVYLPQETQPCPDES